MIYVEHPDTWSVWSEGANVDKLGPCKSYNPFSISGFIYILNVKSSILRILYTLQIQSPCQMMIGVYNHLQNERYLYNVFSFHETILSFGEPGSLGSLNFKAS